MTVWAAVHARHIGDIVDLRPPGSWPLTRFALYPVVLSNGIQSCRTVQWTGIVHNLI